MQAADTIESGNLITLGKRGVVEHGLDEVVDIAAQGHYRLPDVHQFAGALADDVDAEDLAGIAMEDELEPAGSVAANLSAGDLAVIGHAHFVGHILFGELLFRFADEADLRDGVDAVGIKAGVGDGVHVIEGAGDGDAPLLHGDRGQRREADHVAHGEDGWDSGLEVFVDRDASAGVGLEAGILKLQVIDAALAAYGIEQRVAGDFLIALHVGDDGAVGQLLHRFQLFAQAHGYAAVAQVIAEGFDNLLVGELKQPVAFFDQRDADAEDGEHAGVFDADDAAADYDQGARQLGQVHDLVAVDDGAAVDRNAVGGGRLGAHGENDPAGVQGHVCFRALDAQCLRVDEVGQAVDDVNAVAGELGLGHVDLSLDDSRDAKGQVGHGDLVFDPVVHPIDGAVVVARKMEHGFAHRFGGDGAGVDADSADDRTGFDDGDAFFQLGSSNCGALPGRSGADDNQIIFGGAHAFIPQVRKWLVFESLSTHRRLTQRGALGDGRRIGNLMEFIL